MHCRAKTGCNPLRIGVGCPRIDGGFAQASSPVATNFKPTSDFLCRRVTVFLAQPACRPTYRVECRPGRIRMDRRPLSLLRRHLGANEQRSFWSREEGRALHLFERVGGQRYVDSFVFHSASSVRLPNRHKPGETAELPLFKLVPVAAAVHRPWQVFDSPEGSIARIVAISGTT
jgi:hypothetical protein